MRLATKVFLVLSVVSWALLVAAVVADTQISTRVAGMVITAGNTINWVSAWRADRRRRDDAQL